MKIAVITNYSRKNASKVSKNTFDFLSRCNAELYAPYEDIKKLSYVNYLEEDDLFKTADIFIVIGGDGTIIHNAKKAAMFDKPVLGINAGRVGFLAGLEPDEIEKLSLLFKEKYPVEKRMLLEVELNGKKYYALNDAVVSKGNVFRMIDIEVQIGSESLAYRADGLIAATPTGSSAYSLSAGGPMVDSRLESIMLTPISPQSLYARPIILKPDEKIIVSAASPSGTDVYLTVDGEESFPVSEEDKVVIKKSANMYVKLIKLNEGSFLTALSKKFNLLG